MQPLRKLLEEPFEFGLHLTLLFLGDCTKAQQKQARRVAEEIHFPRFDLRFDGAGVFPLRGRPKVLWLGVEKCQPLLDLQKELTAKLRALDFEIEKRKFHPHVTLARIGRSPEERIGRWLEEFAGYRSEPFEVTEFQLIQSVLLQRGPSYTVVDEFECAD